MSDLAGDNKCVTHHYACDCREAEFEWIKAENQRLRGALERLTTGEAMYVPTYIPKGIRPELQARDNFIKYVLGGKSVKDAAILACETQYKKCLQEMP